MSLKNLATWTFALASLLIGASCGGSDAGSTAVGEGGDTETTIAVASDDASSDGGDTGGGDSGTAEAGFGELIEGTFTLSGAFDESYTVGDSALGFRLGGGCQGAGFGVSVNVTDAAATTTYAMISAEMQEDLNGGVTGDFNPVDGTITVFPGGDFSKEQSFSGPLEMIISEHETGGASADLNARRMTIEIVGSIPDDEGALDVDATFRWVMGCP